MAVLQRPFWNDAPERGPDAFRLTKRKGERIIAAACQTWTHPFGWELRLEIEGHGLQMSAVVRSGQERSETADRWKAAMLEKGWSVEANTPRPDEDEPPPEPVPPLDDAPVPPLTEPADTEGG